MNKKEYSIGDIVYLITDPEQRKRIVIAINESCNGFSYRLACGSEEYYSFSVEMDREKRLADI
jgi:hypothetical protein